MKGGYPPVNQPWQGTAAFTARLQNILLWTWKTPVFLWFMDPSGIWESNILFRQPLIGRTETVQRECAVRTSISTRRTWLPQKRKMLPTQLAFLQHSQVSIKREASNGQGGSVRLNWFNPKPKAGSCQEDKLPACWGKGKPGRSSLQFEHVINPLWLSFKHQNLK